MPNDDDDADDNDFPRPVPLPRGSVPVDHVQSLAYDGSSVCDDDDALFQACIEAKSNLPSVDSQGLSDMSSDHSAE